MELGNIYHIKNTNTFVIALAEYTNGVDSTSGFVTKDMLEEGLGAVTYDAQHATELPVEWYKSMFIDENGNRQQLVGISYGSEKPYVMADGTTSSYIVG